MGIKASDGWKKVSEWSITNGEANIVKAMVSGAPVYTLHFLKDFQIRGSRVVGPFETAAEAAAYYSGVRAGARAIRDKLEEMFASYGE